MGLLLAVRPADSRPGGRPAAGHVEQGRVRQGARAPRADARHRRPGTDRAGDRGAGPRLRHAGGGLVAEPHARGGRPARRRLRADAARGGAAGRRGVHQRRRDRRDQAPGERRVPRGDAAGRVPDQHLARLVVDEAALERAVREKGIRAGLDVFEHEPAGSTGTFGNPIVQAPGVYGTHHVGASTEQAQVAIAHEVIRIVQTFQATGEVPNVRQPAGPELGDARALDPAPQPARRAGPRVRRAGRRRRSTSKRSRTSSITAPRPRWRGSTSTACPTRGALERIRSGNQDIISVELSEIDGKAR